MSSIPANLVSMFDQTRARLGDKPFLFEKRDGRYRSLTWNEVGDAADALAAKLAALGIAPGDRVAIIAENGPRWCISDMAILKAGAVTVPSYTTYTTDDYGFVLANSGAQLVICGGAAIAKRLLPAIARCPGILAILALDDAIQAEPGLPPVIPYEAAIVEGRDLPPATAGRERQPDDLACLIYTSGTGGRPKGVMISHRNISANIAGVAALMERLRIENLVFLSFLPLSHSYEHTAGQMVPMAMGAEIWYAEGVETLQTNLLEARPHILTCVPRLFEVFKQRLEQAMARQGGIKARLFQLAVKLGTKAYHGRLAPHEWLLDRLLERLVRRKVRTRFGGRMAAMVSGGGALNPEIGIFFKALGLPVCQGYGQTEASPVISVNPPWDSRLESAGQPLEGVEVKIADDGEILVRGELVMRGYWQEPELTAATIVDGWLKTGDIGRIDATGYIHITDRKKDILVLSGGDNVAPQRVEAILAMEPEIGQVVIFGERKPYIAALVVPAPDLLKAAAKAGRAAIESRIEAAIKRANTRLSSIERVRRWQLVEEPFTVENGMMTPTLKLRRAVILAEHRPLVEKLFAAPRHLAA